MISAVALYILGVLWFRCVKWKARCSYIGHGLVRSLMVVVC